MIARYTRQEMAQVWSDANKLAKWLEVELAATETLAEAGQVPKDAAAAIRSRAKIDVAPQEMLTIAKPGQGRRIDLMPRFALREPRDRLRTPRSGSRD